jgi:hypothetical protein
VPLHAWMEVNILPGMNAGASTYAVPSPIKGSGTAWVLLGSWALSPARPTSIHPRHECRGLSALFGEDHSHPDFPLIHDVQSSCQPQNNVNNIKVLEFYH